MTTKPCSSCRDEIPVDAIVCRQCRNFQGSYWWLRLLGLGLPWIITAASLGAIGYHYYLTHDIPQFATVLKSDFQEISVVVANNGTEALAVPERAQLACTVISPGFLPEGEKDSAKGSYKLNGMYLMKSTPADLVMPNVREIVKFQLPDSELARTIISNSKYCEITLPLAGLTENRPPLYPPLWNEMNSREVQLGLMPPDGTQLKVTSNIPAPHTLLDQDWLSEPPP